jgi:hypothetical protein
MTALLIACGVVGALALYLLIRTAYIIISELLDIEEDHGN